jgi:hypothetical protein
MSASKQLREAIAFNLTDLLKRLAAEGKLGEQDFHEVAMGFYPACEEDREFWLLIDVIRNEIDNETQSLRDLSDPSEDQKRALSHLGAVSAHIDPIWDEFRIKSLNQPQEA